MAGTWNQFMNSAFPEEAQKINEDTEKRIAEAKANIPEKFLEDLADMTDRNAHSEARLEVAKFIKHKQLIKAYQGILDINQSLGYMPNGMSDARYTIDQKHLLPALQSKLGREGASMIWSRL